MKLCIAVVHRLIQKKVNGSVTTAAIGKNREQKEIICPILESSGHNQPFYDDIDNSVCNNIQSQ